VIAEVKRRSPSKGEIAAPIAAGTQAVAYAGGGASAISVLTEPAHFGGSAEDLEAVRARVAIPVLKKDFHLDPLQVLEARALGASGLLLIARALEPARLGELVQAALECGVEPLVEIRDEEELARAIDAGARIVGVNNRNLESLEIDATTAERLVPLIPPDRIAVAESGIESRADVERYARTGADAVLVGSFISAASDPVAAVRGLASVPRSDRAG
jgi:indole-3-glycerol phosphate synthase